jgi:hypothetical protein
MKYPQVECVRPPPPGYAHAQNKMSPTTEKFSRGRSKSRVSDNEMSVPVIAYFLLIRHGPHRKQRQQFFVAAGISLQSCYLATLGRYKQTHRHTRPTILLLLRVFVAAGTCLPCRCLKTKRRIHFTEPLPSNDRRDKQCASMCLYVYYTYRNTD